MGMPGGSSPPSLLYGASIGTAPTDDAEVYVSRSLSRQYNRVFVLKTGHNVVESPRLRSLVLGADAGRLDVSAAGGAGAAACGRLRFRGFSRVNGMIHRKDAAWLALLCLGLLPGCGLVAPWFGADASNAAERARMERLVAEDFASMLASLPATAPERTALTVGRADTPFGQTLLVALRGAGYALEQSDGAVPGRQVHYQRDARENRHGTNLSYAVETGDVSLSRDYSLREDGVYPISYMQVRGTPSLHVSHDDDRFRRQGDGPDIVSGVSHDPAFTDAGDVAALAGEALDLPEGMPVVTVDGRPLIDKRRIDRANMYDTRRSNFADFLDGYALVNREILVFPDDSLSFMASSRRQLEALHESFEPDTDVFSVIGCSHGPTALDDGNRLLALGRSKRVLEALIRLGVSERKVLDEGCWAGVPFDKMPARGVVVELRRQAG